MFRVTYTVSGISHCVDGLSTDEAIQLASQYPDSDILEWLPGIGWIVA